MIGTAQLINTFSRPCFTDTTDIFKDGSGVALYTLDYDGSDAGGASGKFGEAAIFNGSSSKITTSLDFDTLTDYTISMWIKIDVTPSATDFFAGTVSGASALNGFYLGNEPDNQIRFYERNASTTITNLTSTDTINVGYWNHIVAVRDGNTNYLYINNGTPVSISNGSISHNENFTLGKAGSYGSGLFDGSIDQVRIYNTALTSSQVTQLYQENNSTVGTHLLGCIANYNLDGSAKESMGTTAYDGVETDITYRYDGTPTNVDFGVGGKSLYGARFNGSSSFIQTSLSLANTAGVSTSFWFQADTVGSQNPPLYFNNNGGRVDINILSTGSDSATASYNTININSTTAIIGWNHLAIIYTGWASSYTPSVYGSAISAAVYLNGSLIGTVAPIPYGQTDGLRIGRSGGGYYFDGKIDQVRIFSKALSSSEVSKLYGNGAGEIACEYTSTTDDIAFPIANTAYYKLNNNSKDSAKSRGKFNQGATFVGNSAGIVNTTLQLSSTAHSVSLWMKPQDLTATKWQIMFFSAFNGYPSFTLGKRSDQTTSFHYRNESSNEVYFTLSNANTWYHVVVTRNNSGSTVYVNGSSVATDSNSMGTYSSSSYQKASIGSNPNYPAEYFDGTLDQIRVYDVALTSTDVANLYNSETTSTTNTLAFPTGKTAIATYTLDGNGVDVSGNYSGSEGDNIVYAHDGTINGTVNFNFGRFGQSAKIGGTSSDYIDLGTISKLPSYSQNTLDFSWSGWVKASTAELNGTSGSNFFFGNRNGSYQFIGMGGNTNANFPTGEITYYTFGGSGYHNNWIQSPNTYDDGNWHHVVVTDEYNLETDDRTRTIFVDTVQVAQDTVDKQFSNSTGITSIGTNDVNTFGGSIDQVRIYSTILDSDQITELYNEKPETDTSNFKTVLWNGNGGTQYISNVGFEPDFVWIKKRTNDTKSHRLFDSVRGAGKVIYSDLTNAEATPTNELTSFDANGFTLGNASAVNDSDGNDSFVAWVWKAGGDAVSYSASGSQLAAEVSANTAAGFSIVKWTGDTTSNPTVPHGLNQEPDLYIVKELDNGTVSWLVGGNSTLFPETASTASFLRLNTTDDIDQTGIASFGNSGQNLIKVGARTNNTEDSIAYCWHSVSGVSKIGTYEGNAGTKTIYTTDDGTSSGSGGFEPSWVMIKRTDTTGNWIIYDKPRGNGDIELYPDSNSAESNASSVRGITFESDGFTLDNSHSAYNTSGGDFIYMAFK